MDKMINTRMIVRLGFVKNDKIKIKTIHLVI